MLKGPSPGGKRGPFEFKQIPQDFSPEPRHEIQSSLHACADVSREGMSHCYALAAPLAKSS